MLSPMAIYNGSDGEATKALYRELELKGPIGVVGLNLFRANKSSVRAKAYHGGNSRGRHRDQAYEKKQWSMGLLCDVLSMYGGELAITFGWKQDPAEHYNPWVLYVDLPQCGQVSFHSPARGKGPDYPGEWDQKRESAERIIAFCDHVLTGKLVSSVHFQEEASR